MSVWRSHGRTSLTNLSLHLQQCPVCLVGLIWIILEVGSRELYSCFFVGFCFQDLFNIASSSLVHFPSNFFFWRFVSIHVVRPHSRMGTTSAWKKTPFYFSERSEFHMLDSLLTVYHGFTRRMATVCSVDLILLPRCVNLHTNLYRLAS